MNIFLWILQFLLALHTLIGALWKFTNSEQAVSSLQAIPHSIWIGLSFVEILVAIGLALPAFVKSQAKLIPIASLVLVAEMLVYCFIHIRSGESDMSPMIYWGVVAVIAAFIAFARVKLKPVA